MDKYRFIKNRPKPNPEKWKSEKGFNEVLSAVKKSGAPSWTTPAYVLAAASIVAVGALLYWMNSRENEKEEVPPVASVVSDSLAIQKRIDNALDLPFESARIDNSKDTLLVCSDGTEIEIPAGSFATESADSIDFKYRSFKHPVEFIHAQIPMTVVESNEQLESAGMIELRAYQQGNQLELREGKSLEVSLPSRHASDDFQLYKLDEEEEGWVCIGKDEITPIEPEIEKELPEMPSPTSESTLVKEFKKSKSDSLALVRQELKELKESAPIKPRVNNPEAYDFVIDFKPEEFPELKSFRNVSFEIVPGEDGFDPRYYTVIWEDVQLKKVGQIFQVILTKEGQSVSLRVWPVVSSGDYQTSLARFEKDFAQYEQKRTERLEEEARLEQDIDALVSSKEARQEYYEKNKKTWDDNLKRINLTLWKTKNFEGIIKRSFEVSSMGTYNCDRVINSPVNQVALKLMARNGQKLALNNVYIINGNRNTAYRFTSTMLNSAFYLANGGPNMVVCFDEDATNMFYGFIKGPRTPLSNKTTERLVMESLPIDQFNRDRVNELFIQYEEPNA